MNAAIVHRGPDGEGFFFHDQHKQDSFRIGMGHRRLKIVDLSDRSKQPMTSDCGRFVIIFNGEIYNFRTLRDTLQKEGHAFHSDGDTEVLLKAYQVFGTACLQKIRGMFAFIIFDTKTERVFMARDPFGIKPLYYWISSTPDNQGFFAASSEIKQFTHLPKWEAIANTERLEEYITSGLQDHTHETLFKGVYQLHPGHFYEGSLSPQNFLLTQPYISQHLEKTTRSFKDASQHFQKLFLKSLEQHRESDVDMGCGVSGGLDSSSIVYGLAFQKPDVPLTTFSTYSTEKDYDERPYIQRVQEDIKGTHHLIAPPKTPVTLEMMKRITWFHDEPLGTPSIFSEWFVYEGFAKTPIKVTLEGHGADEILGGYLTFIPFYIKHLWHQKRYTQLVYESFWFVIRYIWLFKRKFKTLVQKSKQQNLWKGPFLNITSNGFVALNPTPTPRASVMTWRQQEIYHTSLQKQLHWADRDAMAHSIEARVPFLDKDLVDFVLSCPGSYLHRKGWSKALLRQGLSQILPDMIRKRTTKIGFPFEGQLNFMKTSDFLVFIEKELSKIPLSVTTKSLFHEALEKNSFDETFWRIVSVLVWQETFQIRYSLSRQE